MSNYRITSRYGKALLDLAVERNELETVHKDVELVQRALDVSRELLLLFKNPVVMPQKKNSVFVKVFEGKLSKMTEHFVSLLIRKNRASLIDEVLDMFVQLYKEKHNISEAKLITATEATDSLQQEVKKLLEDATKETIDLSTKTEEELIGGFKIRYKDRLIDASVSSKLKELRNELLD